MPYDVTLAQIDAGIGGFGRTGSPGGNNMGFPSDPAGFPFTAGYFTTLLYSQWLCGVGVGCGPAMQGFIGFNSSGSAFNCANYNPSHIGTDFGFNGSFAAPADAVRHHYLVSINTRTQTVQLYVDDQYVPVIGTWTAPPSPPGYNAFNLAWDDTDYWTWDNSGTLLIDNRPGMGDVFVCNLPGDTWVDLSVVANRRKFINADLTPVYLGTNGQVPFGTEPQIYCTVPSGSTDPTDFLVNRGTGGGSFGSSGGVSFQAPGTCSLPTPPPVLLPPQSLSLDNLLVTGPALVPSDNRIFLDWSNDRGHSYGNMVGQPIGAPGAYLTSVQWQRLGLARDRVFRLTWSTPVATALQGAWIEVAGVGSS